MRGDAPFIARASTLCTTRSPHARGCTDTGAEPSARVTPFPACAGMHRRRPVRLLPGSTVPRMRGDAPASITAVASVVSRSPHARGFTGFLDRARRRQAPFPACAGMHRGFHSGGRGGKAVPRMRGDAPTFSQISPTPDCRSPHARGCTARSATGSRKTIPFPAYAGMHRAAPALSISATTVPRMRGDAPVRPVIGRSLGPRSPHARGCTECSRSFRTATAPSGIHRIARSAPRRR